MGDPTSRRHRRRALFVAVALLVPLLGLPARADDPLDPYFGDPGRTYPNLVPNVELVDIRLTRAVAGGSGSENGLFLFFDTRAQNLGTVPVQVTIDEVESPETSTVSQCISWRAADSYLCRETEIVGGYTWHDAHTHFHYEDFASYELRTLNPDGTADYSDAGLLRTSSKVSFCFYDIEQVPEAGGSPVPYYTTGGCLAPVFMGISPGWTDIYGEDLEGQNLDIEGVPNGRYALITEINYEGTLRETNIDDNLVEVVIEISDSREFQHLAGRKAEIVGKRWPTPAERRSGSTTTAPSTTSTTTVEAPRTTEPPAGPVRVLRPVLSINVPQRRAWSSGDDRCSMPDIKCTRRWARPSGRPPG